MKTADPNAFIGVLMLDTRFERVVGDVGNEGSYPFPTQMLTVPDADPTAVASHSHYY